MRYQIEVVGDDELPEGLHAVIVERSDGTVLMLISGEPARTWRFSRAYEDAVEPCAGPSILTPARPLIYAV